MRPRATARRALSTLASAAALVACTLLHSPAAAQIPDEFRNLKVLPADIAPDSLVQLMRSFSFATGLRCEGCHVMGPDGSFTGARFDLDEKTNKLRARAMLEMVRRINDDFLPAIPERESPGLAVECKTCHRGQTKPWLLRTELRRVIAEQGIDSAVARYRYLRANETLDGTWDFGEWEVNELAREVAAAGNDSAAVAFLVLNAEFYPASRSIPLALGPLYERMGRREEAIAAYRRVLELDPRNRTADQRLRALGARD